MYPYSHFTLTPCDLCQPVYFLAKCPKERICSGEQTRISCGQHGPHGYVLGRADIPTSGNVLQRRLKDKHSQKTHVYRGGDFYFPEFFFVFVAFHWYLQFSHEGYCQSLGQISFQNEVYYCCCVISVRCLQRYRTNILKKFYL